MKNLLKFEKSNLSALVHKTTQEKGYEMKEINDVDYELEERNIKDLINPNKGVTTISPSGNIYKLLKTLKLDFSELIFVPSQKETNTGVIQNFSVFGNFDENSIWSKLGNKISNSLFHGFCKLNYPDLLARPLKFNELTLQHYPQSKSDDEYAISPHRDQSGFINLVVIMLVFGPSSFFICKDRKGTTTIDPEEIFAYPGDLIVMRGGLFGHHLTRPCHFVRRVDDTKGRLTLSLRQITDDQAVVKKMEGFFNRKFKST